MAEKKAELDARIKSAQETLEEYEAKVNQNLLTDEEIRDLKSAPMSGDWRRIGGNLELMAVLAVNLPGFPVLRTKALVASGATQSLFVPIEAEKTETASLSIKIVGSDEVSGRFEALETKLARIQRAYWASVMEKE